MTINKLTAINAVKKVYNILTKPFGENLPLFAVTWFCSAFALFAYYLPLQGVAFSLHYAFIGGFMAYLLILLIGVVFKEVPGWLKCTIIFISILNLIADITILQVKGNVFEGDAIAMIFGTNKDEATEFFQAYWNNTIILQSLIYTAIGLALYYSLTKIWHYISPFTKPILSLVFLGILLFTNITKTESWHAVYYGKISLFLDYEKTPDLREYASHPQIIYNDDKRPENLVIIIGESLSKRHSNLYDYKLDTNPHLNEFKNSGHLIVFQDIESPAPGTGPAFKNFMSTYNETIDQDKNWYECTTIFDLLSEVKIRSNWISNQSRVGAYDNVITRFGELAHFSKWVGMTGGGMTKKDYDELVLPYVDSISNSPTGSCTFVHLIGQHESFQYRYPEKLNVFKEDDYSEFPSNQRATLAHYDNSVLYNDYVVSEIINKYSDKESVVIYFSDHSLDIFDTDPSFAGHAKNTEESRNVGIQIPFMIFLSDKYQENFPTMTQSIISSANNTWNTTDLIYTIADLIGVESINSVPVIEHSLFTN